MADLSSDATCARELLWRQPHVPHELPAVADALAAVSPPASDEPAVNIQGPDSNADYRIAHRRSDRTLSADKREVEIRNFQATVTRRCYTDCVPREVLLPSGPPDRLLESRSGTFIEAPHARQPRPPENLAHPSGRRETFLPFEPPRMLPARLHPAPQRSAARRKLQGRKHRSKCRRVKFFEGNNHRKETREVNKPLSQWRRSTC